MADGYLGTLLRLQLNDAGTWRDLARARMDSADLKTEAGQKRIHKELARTDVLLTSFRPSGRRRAARSCCTWPPAPRSASARPGRAG